VFCSHRQPCHAASGKPPPIHVRSTRRPQMRWETLQNLLNFISAVFWNHVGSSLKTPTICYSHPELLFPNSDRSNGVFISDIRLGIYCCSIFEIFGSGNESAPFSNIHLVRNYKPNVPIYPEPLYQRESAFWNGQLVPPIRSYHSRISGMVTNHN